MNRGLGVSTSFSRERNLQIILERYKEDPKRTKAQLNFLKHFPAFAHHKNETDCACLACEGLRLITKREGGD